MYGIGKLRGRGKLPLTALGLTAIVLAPKGFELLKSCSDNTHEIKKMQIYASARKDSLELVMKVKEYEKQSVDDNTVHFHDALNTVVQTNKELSATYDKIIDKTKGYDEAIKSTNENYAKITSTIEKEHKNLEDKINNISVEQEIILQTMLPRPMLARLLNLFPNRRLFLNQRLRKV